MKHIIHHILGAKDGAAMHMAPLRAPLELVPSHIILGLLFMTATAAWAQGSDSPYVIKVKGSDHYLAHVKVDGNWVLQDATTFGPECIWYSGIEQNITGTTHNYYFIDDSYNLRFLMAPLEPNGTLGLSASLPATYKLSNTDLEYYFYDWDAYNGDGGGVARGHQYTEILSSGDCTHQWGDNQCWDVFWVAYYNGGWTTSINSYNIDGLTETPYSGGRYHKVTVTDYKITVSGGLTGPDDIDNMTYNSSVALMASVSPYSYKTYTQYHFVENTGTYDVPNLVEHDYYYYATLGGTPSIYNAAPENANGTENTVTTYEWSLSGDGAQYLSFASGSEVLTSSASAPTLYYRVNNLTGDKVAVLKLKVTYAGGETQETTANVTVKTECQNPALVAAAKVYYNDATVSWYNIAERYRVYLKKTADADWGEHVATITATSAEVMSYTFTGLDETTEYQYKIQARCGESWQGDPTAYSFTTSTASDLMIYGSVFGGGRMADVTGNTEVVIVNCDSIGAVYGGNDIAGHVQGSAGSTIVLGVNAGDANAVAYNNSLASTKVRVNDVYGGGNGYYAYNGSSFVAASDSYGSQSVAVSGTVNVMNRNHTVGEAVWTNSGTVSETLNFPTIVKTAITVTNDVVKVDSIFGGAKNAFITNAVANADGTSITVNGGTIYTVFGGNNFGGTQTAGKHHVEVNGTTVKSLIDVVDPENTYYSKVLGRDFGIAHVFGGGNKVMGNTSDVVITGGQCDTVFAGGNEASVAEANVTINCVGSSKVWTDAVESWVGDNVGTIKSGYLWDGTGIYNVRALFGGNNKQAMTVVPTITLTSGSIGILYGGGNAGNMNGEDATHNTAIANDFGAVEVDYSTNPVTTRDINISTHVVLNSANVLIDYLYGGCQMSDVYRSTWVEISNGHVGTVYGGCNISGDVGSRYLLENDDPLVTAAGVSGAYKFGPRSEKYQAVKGATYVKVSGGYIYNDLFAGSNGCYRCNDGRNYIAGIDFDDAEGRYIGMSVPTHNETHVLVSGGDIGKNVYAGGNLACVGFINESVPKEKFYTPTFVGFAMVKMTGGHVHGSVFGGGNMASIWGSNAVEVSGGTIDSALYGGNDRIGIVAQITNRVLPPDYDIASDGHTSLSDVRTYISLTGRPEVNTVYGGGNGDYNYERGKYCNTNDQPVQSHTFVDINIDGYTDGSHPKAGHIGTVYGGGNGVTVTGSTTVFLNVKGNPAVDGEPVADVDHVGTIFGGNNKGPLDILPDIILLKGHVNTVYGGCNQGAMEGSHDITVGGTDYSNVGSMVRLRDSYTAGVNTITPTASVTGAVYGGCRMNGVNNNTLILVEHGIHPANFFGGSDISGTIGGTSHVVVTGGQTGNIYGGGNGNYDYDGNNVYIAGSDHSVAENLVVSGSSAFTAPVCSVSQVDILGGQVGASGTGNDRSIFGGGWGSGTSTSGNVEVNIGPATASGWSGLPVIYGDIYGGSALGSVNSSNSNTTTVSFLNGTLHGNLFGGGLGLADVYEEETLTVDNSDKGKTYGKVFVNISNGSQAAANCFIDLRDASIYGCNNTNGSPQDDVTVNIYRTSHTTTDEAGYTAGSGDPTFAIDNVFGGGRSADYAPLESSNKATVHVFGCENTIRRVFGGGDAAAAYKVATIIEGGRMDQVFGGGNGETTPANIGAGGIELDVSGGKIRQLFGGNNTRGQIAGPMSINVTNSGSCTEDITEFFGGSNAAPMGTAEDPVTLTTTIGCNTVNPVAIANVYGGSNLAAITGDVTLTIKGGTFTNVYAGSKGIAGTAADITGNTTLNLYGGTVSQNAFGGNNVNGNITGQITVNVLDYELCKLDLNNIYGASNATAYIPTNSSSTSPVINVMHLREGTNETESSTIRGNIYGGGNQGAVTANPVVNIGYDANTMTIPGDYPATSTFHTMPRAYVEGNVFGGGNQAGVTGAPTINMRSGTVLSGLYGGCNASGTITGNTTISFTGGTMGAAAVGTSGDPGYVAQQNANIYGGGLGAATKVMGDVEVTINAPSGNIYGDIYGGSAKGLVNCNAEGTAQNDSSKTDVLLSSGTVHGTIYGGGLGDLSSFGEGHSNIEANVWGPVTVTVEGGNVDNVFGCNNLNGQPQNAVTVEINGVSASIGNVFGGGNEAYYDNTPNVIIEKGTVTNNVFGGGNNITTDGKGVGGSNIEMLGGTVLGGIYGGCNTDGDVKNDSRVTIYGGTVGTSETPGNIFGGGFGENTKVLNDVFVKFGDIDDDQSESPMLYGDLYGGSALGTVNKNNSNWTYVNINNGTIEGNVFGGGMGQVGQDTYGQVNGKISVKIGDTVGSELKGNATLYNCDVYGCNNVNGSPKDEVFVNVYKTYRREKDAVEYNAMDATYAINQVFGGGNKASYSPNGNFYTHVYVYGCDNTVQFIYAGGNAADAYGVEIVIEGGRFREAYGGGNGLLTPANIGAGGTGFNFHGYYYFTFEGSNKQGDIGVVRDTPPFEEGRDECGETFVSAHFFGANEAESYVDVLENTIRCSEAEFYNYTSVYAGSRWAIIYGDVKLTVEGGTIKNLYGGSQGYEDFSADIRKYPTLDSIEKDQERDPSKRKYSNALLAYMGYMNEVSEGVYTKNLSYVEPTYAGTGGNVTLVITGGTIGSVIGGCDLNGKVEGKITVIVDETDDGCNLNIGNVYGACNKAYYEPNVEDAVQTPKVEILRGTLGMAYDFNGNTTIEQDETYKGNVFGGGYLGNVKCNPKVIIGDGDDAPVTIGGDVFGGGDEGDVDGKTEVVIAPSPKHQLTITQPAADGRIVTPHFSTATDMLGEDVGIDINAIPAECKVLDHWEIVSGNGKIERIDRASTTFTMGTSDAVITAHFKNAQQHVLTLASVNGSIAVKNSNNVVLTSGADVCEGSILDITATPDANYAFSSWEVSGRDSKVSRTKFKHTTFTMGTENATLTAKFVPVHSLNIISEHGTVTVTDVEGQTLSGNPLSIGEHATLGLAVTASEGYRFKRWSVSGNGSNLSSSRSLSTTLTMGYADATLTATFVAKRTITVTLPPASDGTITVNGVPYTAPVVFGEGDVVEIVATPAEGKSFSGWSVTGDGSFGDSSAGTTTFTVGNTDATITATFE